MHTEHDANLALTPRTIPSWQQPAPQRTPRPAQGWIARLRLLNII